MVCFAGRQASTAEAEGVPGGIAQYARAVRARLVLALGGTEPDGGCLGGVEVVDRKVEVHLLRPIL